MVERLIVVLIFGGILTATILGFMDAEKTRKANFKACVAKCAPYYVERSGSDWCVCDKSKEIR